MIGRCSQAVLVQQLKPPERWLFTYEFFEKLCSVFGFVETLWLRYMLRVRMGDLIPGAFVSAC